MINHKISKILDFNNTSDKKVNKNIFVLPFSINYGMIENLFMIMLKYENCEIFETLNTIERHNILYSDNSS